MGTMKAAVNALKDLEAAIAKACDALAKDGLYIEGISINSRGTERDPFAQSYPQRWSYKREIQVRLTNKAPEYVASP